MGATTVGERGVSADPRGPLSAFFPRTLREDLERQRHFLTDKLGEVVKQLAENREGLITQFLALEPLFRQLLQAQESETVTSLLGLAKLLASKDRNSEAESLFKLSIAILDTKGWVTAKRFVLVQSFQRID